MKITIRPQRIYDAKRFVEILSNQNFIYFPAKPKTIKEEKEFLRLNSRKRKDKTEFNFSIIYNCKEHVGGIGVRIDQFRSFIGEIGYFVDEKYWGKGIATRALKQLEEFYQIYHCIALKSGWQKKTKQAKKLPLNVAIERKASYIRCYVLKIVGMTVTYIQKLFRCLIF